MPPLISHPIDTGEVSGANTPDHAEVTYFTPLIYNEIVVPSYVAAM
jgi:hypothetical protein